MDAVLPERILKRWTALPVLLFASTQALYAQTPFVEIDCLNAITQGDANTPVVACPSDGPDVLGRAEDPDIKAIVRALGLENVDVRFVGCGVTTYSMRTLARAESGRGYVVVYPMGQSLDFLAPIAHELAHILQKEMEGATPAPMTTDRRELGADFVTGLLYQALFRGSRPMREFQTNLGLMGSFGESNPDFHGRPGQRNAAFRFGVNRRDFAGNYREEITYFTENLYGQIIR